MVVVVRDRGPIGVILLIISILSLLSIVVLIFLISQGRGNITVIAIPGFPPGSIVAGLVVGVFLIVIIRSSRRKKTAVVMRRVSHMC